MDTTRSRVLDAALAVFAERGADGGSMREIARRAGVNVATAYHHFGSKRDLLLAIFKDLGFIDRPELYAWDSPDNGRNSVDVLEETILLSLVFMETGSSVIRVALGEALKGDAEILDVFERWRATGDSFLRNRLLHVGLADEGNVDRRAWTLRQAIWATFVEMMCDRSRDIDWVRPRARWAAESLVEGWTR